MTAVPATKFLALTPATFILNDIFTQFKDYLPKYQSKFAPELSYEQVMRDVYALRLHDPDNKFLNDDTTLPLFAYTRGPLQRLEEQEMRYTGKTFSVGVDNNGQNFNLDLRFGMASLDVNIRAFFPDPKSYDEFEANYITNTSINAIRNGGIKIPYLNQTAKYTCIWSDLEDVDWATKSKGQVSVALSLQILGPTITYQGPRSAIEKIILEFRDYDNPDIVYDVEEFQLQPRPDPAP